MPHLLLIDDDPLQMDLRRRVLERAGHAVSMAATPAEALEAAGRTPPDCILMDLRMPGASDGRALLRDLKRLVPESPVIVLTGMPQDLESTPEAALAGALLRKPVRSETLFAAIRRLVVALAFCTLWLPAQTREFPFKVTDARSEIVADVDLSSPGGDWALEGAEASTARLEVSGLPPHHVIAFGGPRRQTYSVFLGRLPPGGHTLKVSREVKQSAAMARLEIYDARIREVKPGDTAWDIVAHAPVLYPRANTIGKFSDIPLLVYVTRAIDGGQRVLEYTVIFSNEDGGTSTRSLMARWGRPTDIEYVYRVWLDARGTPARTLIQTRNHKDVPYDGRREGFHPVLETVTDNNMVEPARGFSTVRYQPLPVEVDLSQGSREIVMDQFPLTYAIAAKELMREGKLRPPGRAEDESISDPRRYLTVELKLAMENGAVQVFAERRGSPHWFGSAAGRVEDFVFRSGWVRVAIELPPQANPDEITALAVQCMVNRDPRKKGEPNTARCGVEAIGQVFFLGNDYMPRPSLRFAGAPAALEGGAMAVFRRQP
jgi:CheY-like chemotaxis protein